MPQLASCRRWLAWRNGHHELTDFLLKRGNSELARHGIYSWSIPALSVKSDRGLVCTCPNAGACAALCYARNGTYLFQNVRAAHLLNLEGYLAGPDAWEARLIQELSHRRYRPSGRPHPWEWVRPEFSWWQESGAKAVRIHDAGDFFHPRYTQAWLNAAAKAPDVLFYAYTKEVNQFKAFEMGCQIPPNFVVIYSLGGKQDHLIDLDRDRHADVFPSLESLESAGYEDQSASDLMAPLLTTNRIGIVRNNIRHLIKRMGDRSFGQL